MNPHSYRLKGRDFVHQGKIEIDVNERAVFIRTQGCFFVYTNSDCFLNSFVESTERKHYMFYIVFNFAMAVIMFLFGIWFYRSKGQASKFLSGYNMKSAEERKKYDENAMCKAYGKRMMFMSIPFIAGMIIDIWYIGIGCLMAWVIWFVMFILLLMDRHKREG